MMIVGLLSLIAGNQSHCIVAQTRDCSKDFHKLDVRYWRRGATDDELERSLLDPIHFSFVTHGALLDTLRVWLKPELARSYPTPTQRCPIIVDGCFYYLSWIDKLVLLLLLSFVSSWFITAHDPANTTPLFPEKLRSFLWSHKFSSINSKPLFMPLWDQPAKDRQRVWSIALDYHDLVSRITTTATPSPLSFQVYRIVMYNEVLSANEVPESQEVRIGLLRYFLMNPARPEEKDCCEYGPSSFNKLAVLRNIWMQCQTVENTINRGVRDYNSWCRANDKIPPNEWYTENVEKHLGLIQPEPVIRYDTEREHKYPHRVQWMTYEAATLVLTHNHEFDLLRRIDSSMIFGFVEKQQTRDCVDLDSRVYAYDVWNQESGRTEVLLMAQTPVMYHLLLKQATDFSHFIPLAAHCPSVYDVMHEMDRIKGTNAFKSVMADHATFVTDLFEFLRMERIEINNSKLLFWWFAPLFRHVFTLKNREVVQALRGAGSEVCHARNARRWDGAASLLLSDAVRGANTTAPMMMSTSSDAVLGELCLYTDESIKTIKYYLKLWFGMRREGQVIEQPTKDVIQLLLGLPQLVLDNANIAFPPSVQVRATAETTAPQYLMMVLGESAVPTVPCVNTLQLYASRVGDRVLSPLVASLAHRMPSVSGIHLHHFQHSTKRKAELSLDEYKPQYDSDDDDIGSKHPRNFFDLGSE